MELGVKRVFEWGLQRVTKRAEKLSGSDGGVNDDVTWCRGVW